MENKRECPECKTKYEPTRSDQKFCNATCRWNAWRKKQAGKKDAKETKPLSGIDTSAPEKNDLFSSLRGIPENKTTEIKLTKTETIIEPVKVVEIKEIPQTVAVETKEYKNAIAEKQLVDTFGKRVIADLQTCDAEISELNTIIEQLSKTTSKNYKLRNWGVDMQDLFGEEKFNGELNKSIQMDIEKQNLQNTKIQRGELMKKLNQANKEMNNVVTHLKTIPQFETPKPIEKKISLAEIMSGFQSKKIEQAEEKAKNIIQALPQQIENNINEPLVTNVFQEENVFENIEEPNTNDKLVSSRDLRKRKYNSFPFTGKWKDFFGLPSYSFHLAVHGKPGEGKSTFCVQFADYLAKNFGKVVYVSGEEGLSKTVQDKIINNGIDNPYLFFADIKSYNEIKTEIPNEYHFVFIDSLDTLRIDAPKLKALKEHYPQSAFITISQSTKDGKMRGSQEITHDTDIAAKVENGVAITTKNRFQGRGTEFQVFPVRPKSFSKLIDETRNII
jgi:hypothetical protein